MPINLKPASGSDGSDGAGGDGLVNEGGPIDTSAIPAGSDTPRRGGWPKGKPRGSSASAGASAGSSNGGNSSAGNKKEKRAALDLSTLAVLMVSVHKMAASKFGPQWEMEQPESELILKSVGDVMQHFTPKANQKVADITTLCTVLAFAYGPRIAISVSEKSRPQMRVVNNEHGIAAE